MNQDGEIAIHWNISTNPEVFLKTITPFREDIVVADECIFTWYLIADLCTQENILFDPRLSYFIRIAFCTKTRC